MTVGFSSGVERNLSSIDLSSIFKNLIGSSILDNVTLSQFWNLIGTSTNDKLDLGDVFNGLTGLIGSIGSDDNSWTHWLNQVLGSGLGSSSSLEAVLKEISSALTGVNVSSFSNVLGDVLGGLDQNYYSLLDGISLDDFLSGLDRWSSNVLPNLGSDLGSIDVLDGLGDILNQLGRSRLLNGITLNDLIRGDGAANVLNGLSTNDLLLGLAGDDRLLGNRGADLLNGGAGADVVQGWHGNDILVGLVDRDDLHGGGGSDILWGGLNADRYMGGRGADYFVLDYKTGLDTILDFTAADVLVLPKQLGDLRISERGNDTLLSVGRTAIALLKGVAANDLSSINVISLDQGIG
ncbi:MAG: hypothetical protein IGS38_01450 [Synechococcales cyanobacterium M58_A2018_015]|nr:hypothetical protein [Synechococcales cyanobacterium M58_A2018_015]